MEYLFLLSLEKNINLEQFSIKLKNVFYQYWANQDNKFLSKNYSEKLFIIITI